MAAGPWISNSSPPLSGELVIGDDYDEEYE